mmetsp:Transcript_7950/g.28267  ORF Transcript_7950/g.28267 Transcript_7950/m.28267 type:complete len:141 (+) Transcript_7950:907-1329(+)
MREKDRCMEANRGPACGKGPNTSSSDTMRCEGCSNIHSPLDSTPDAVTVESSLLASCHRWKCKTDPSASNPFLPEESTANPDGCGKWEQPKKAHRKTRRSTRAVDDPFSVLRERRRRSEMTFLLLTAFLQSSNLSRQNYR